VTLVRAGYGPDGPGIPGSGREPPGG
jgi:hypothetical protein